MNEKYFNCSNICFKENSKIYLVLNSCIENCNQIEDKYEYNKICYKQCPNNTYPITNEYLCYDIVTPIKIEMFMRMKIINVSCGESHVLAITEDNCIKTLFSWGSNRFGQLGQGIQTKQSMPKIVNYFLLYNF